MTDKPMLDLVAALSELTKYQAPDGWRVETEPGWLPSLESLLANAADPEVRFEVNGTEQVEWAGVRLPKFFVVNAVRAQDNDYLAMRLFMTINHDHHVEFWGATSTGPDLNDNLKTLFQIRPLDWWKRQALLWLRTMDGEDLVRALSAARQSQQRRNNRITPTLLADVARVYREAMARGEAPTQAVANHFRISRANAAKWVSRARQDRYLGASVGPTGGELGPVDFTPADE